MMPHSRSRATKACSRCAVWPSSTSKSSRADVPPVPAQVPPVLAFEVPAEFAPPPAPEEPPGPTLFSTADSSPPQPMAKASADNVTNACFLNFPTPPDVYSSPTRAKPQRQQYRVRHDPGRSERLGRWPLEPICACSSNVRYEVTLATAAQPSTTSTRKGARQALASAAAERGYPPTSTPAR